ncbi:Hypothetical predicted protein [Paramuricea clavata]|uniref:Uncharacterized protein n=1 Tax=Paramuricea clavata TaxID=317549 RepID=A0A7D9ELG4_PARCT|nr:Hypothetical predicted protein [Paramuricea clavata]
MVLKNSLLDDLAQSTGFPVDQLSFIIGMLVTLFLAIFYNLFLSPRKVGRTTRLTVGLVWGICIGWLCFASEIIQLIILPMLCYLIIHTVSPRVVHRYIFTLAMSWLSANHIYRQVTDYGGYKLDITGPLMLITQRVTYVGFALHDGLGRDPKELTNEQRQHRIKKKPSFLEFFSYILHFTMVLAGHSCTYFEFMEFIDGTNMKEFKGTNVIPVMTITRKIVLAYIFLGGVVLGNALISAQTCVDPQFMSQTSLFTKIVFGYFVILATKMRYYYAWVFADGVVNAAGMGFNGYDEKGEPLWDKFTSAKVKNIELATNARTIIVNWNIGTEKWLKRIIYNRANDRLSGVLATSVTSAFWHGFYPGYYLCFVNVAFVTLSARKARRSFHAYFQDSKEKKIFYDILTWLTTYSLVSYICMPFVLLQLDSGLIFWRSVYFYGHIIILLGFASPWISAVLGMKREEKSTKVNGAREMTGETINSYRINNSRPKEE